jgi:hypothetical protein
VQSRDFFVDILRALLYKQNVQSATSGKPNL